LFLKFKSNHESIADDKLAKLDNAFKSLHFITDVKYVDDISKDSKRVVRKGKIII